MDKLVLVSAVVGLGALASMLKKNKVAREELCTQLKDLETKQVAQAPTVMA